MKTSVALCTYNGEKYIKQQLDSILKQTVPVDEIIVCDDGSTDTTISIINSYQKQYPEIFKVHINEQNLRSVKNFEKAVSLCTNEIIFLSDQDDIWIDEKVQIYLNHFNKNPNISVIASNGYGIDENDNILNVITIWDVIPFIRKTGKELNYFEIISFSGNIATGATMAIKKDFIQKTIPFPMVPEFHHDEWIALIAASENKFDFLDTKTFYYRQHQNQQVGGVFFENTEKRKDRLIKFFNPNFNDISFSNYKHILKRTCNSYKKNVGLLNNTTIHRNIFIKNIELFEGIFHKYKHEMMKKYPFRSFFLNISDKINNKRQLK